MVGGRGDRRPDVHAVEGPALLAVGGHVPELGRALRRLTVAEEGEHQGRPGLTGPAGRLADRFVDLAVPHRSRAQPERVGPRAGDAASDRRVGEHRAELLRRLFEGRQLVVGAVRLGGDQQEVSDRRRKRLAHARGAGSASVLSTVSATSRRRR